MERISRIALYERKANAVILIGADTPGLPMRLLNQAKDALLNNDVVLGPTDDGGFYLLGLKRCPEGLLKEIPWSDEDTFRSTLLRLGGLQLKVAILDPWFDVDRPEDLRRLAYLIGRCEIEAPVTHRTLLNIRSNVKQKISVVIPTLNEEKRIGTRLKELQSMEGIDEVIVADGGSTDRTVEIVRSFPNARLIQGGSGRSTQMNAGAKAATGDVLLFLHADVRLPSKAADSILKTLREPCVVGGAFRTWTVADDGPSWLSPLLHLADFRSRYTKLPYGDQAIFVQADVFRSIGGFPNQPLMEDLEFSRRVWRHGKLRIIRENVYVSGRRMLSKPIYFLLAINLFPLLYFLGMSPKSLAALYGDPR